MNTADTKQSVITKLNIDTLKCSATRQSSATLVRKSLFTIKCSAIVKDIAVVIREGSGTENVLHRSRFSKPPSSPLSS